LGLQVNNVRKKILKENCSNITSKEHYTISPRILQETQEILQNFNFIIQERLPNGTNNHKRKWERRRERGERFWHNRVAVKSPCENEERRLSFI